LTATVHNGIVVKTMTDTPTDYDNPWVYKGTTFTTNDIDNFFGFVYRITNLQTGKQYIGRKYFYQFRKPRGKSRKVKSESDWKKYYGSSDELTADRKSIGNECFKREIISLHTTKGWVNYEETRQLFLNNVLSENENYYNSNILGRYMRKDYYNEQRTTVS